MFTPQNLSDVCSRISQTTAIIFATPNYEERSVFALAEVLDACREKNADLTRVFVRLLWPRGDSQRVDLLEQLKQTYFGRLREQLSSIDHETCVITYPENYSSNLVVNFISESVRRFHDDKLTVLVDISTMPRRILVSVCDAVRLMLDGDVEGRISVLFCYTGPQRYATVNYAQNVGAVQGYFSGRPIHEGRADHISAAIFPSLQGYEGKLLFDELRGWTSRSVKAFVAVGGKDYLTALATMRANQFLLEQRDIGITYYYSLQDGIVKLLRLLDQEAIQSAENDAGLSGGTRMIVIAPFGPKVFTLAAYFGLHELRTKAGGRCDIEIAHVSGFQYLSLYSLGAGEVFFWGLKLREEGLQ